jgi:DNA end-binding protein Ku
MAARNIWKGSISFGLVNIPVKVFTTTEYEEYSSFNQLCKKGHRIKYKKWCPVEEREVPYSEIKKGYEVSKGNYIVIEKEDLEKIKLKTTNTMEINEFIDSEDFDTIFIEKYYYISPATGKKNNNTTPSSSSAKAYSLFVKVLKETNKIAIGKVVLGDKEHLVTLRAYQRGIVMHQMKYLDEISNSQQAKIDNKEINLEKILVDNITAKEFDISNYSDTYAKEIEKLITTKKQARDKTTSTQTDKEIEEGKQETTEDLLEALKASIRKSKPIQQKVSGE